jgi:hypothetical protein
MWLFWTVCVALCGEMAVAGGVYIQRSTGNKLRAKLD